jgi:hypothetical protein
MFSKMIELTSGIGGRISGGMVEVEQRETGMPADGRLFAAGRVVAESDPTTLGVKVFTGTAATAALALNRMTAAPEPPLRRSDRSLSLDERLRRLGVRVADR